MNTKLLFILLSLSFFSYTYAKEKSDVDLNSLVLETPKTTKTKEDYKKKEDLLTPIEEKTAEAKKEKDGIGISGSVDINKEEKKIEGLHFDLNSKF